MEVEELGTHHDGKIVTGGEIPRRREEVIFDYHAKSVIALPKRGRGSTGRPSHHQPTPPQLPCMIAPRSHALTVCALVRVFGVDFSNRKAVSVFADVAREV